MIVGALLLGALCGLFFGEYTSWVKWIGDAYVGLLQMAVLPYQTRDEILKTPDLKLAVIKGSYFAERAAKVLPEIELIELSPMRF